MIGKADLDISAYVTAGGAGTFTNVGYTKGPLTVDLGQSQFESKAEQVLGSLNVIPIEFKPMVKATLLQSNLDLLQEIINQPAANLTGVAPNKVLLIGDPVESYYQVKITGKAIASTAGVHGTQTILLWRCAFTAVEPIGHAKDNEKVYGITLVPVYDETLATADKYGKITDAGGS